MLQIYVAWYQLISSHPTSCIAVCWRLDDPDPFLQGPPIPQGGAGYHCSICILNLSYFPLRYLIWSSFQYLILTYILVTHFSIHVSLAWNQVSSSYPTSCQLMSYDHDHGRGVGGGPGTWNIYNVIERGGHLVVSEMVLVVWQEGFDPMGFSLAIDIRWLREAELKHGRVAMLATLGWITTVFWRKQIGGSFESFELQGILELFRNWSGINMRFFQLLFFYFCRIFPTFPWRLLFFFWNNSQDLGLRVPGDAFQISTLEAHDAMVKFGSMPQILAGCSDVEMVGFLEILALQPKWIQSLLWEFLNNTLVV